MSKRIEKGTRIKNASRSLGGVRSYLVSILSRLDAVEGVLEKALFEDTATRSRFSEALVDLRTLVAEINRTVSQATKQRVSVEKAARASLRKKMRRGKQAANKRARGSSEPQLPPTRIYSGGKADGNKG